MKAYTACDTSTPPEQTHISCLYLYFLHRPQLVCYVTCVGCRVVGSAGAVASGSQVEQGGWVAGHQKS